MKCDIVKMPDGSNAIVCSSRRVPRCGFCTTRSKPRSRFQCDWKVGKDKTCDAHLCDAHAREVDKNKHLCPVHQSAYASWLLSKQRTVY